MSIPSATHLTQDEIAETLSRDSSWPESDHGVEWIQTHISHVFLVGERVFKMRKAVRLPFLDFGSRASRNADCSNELKLNRRLAPSVYLGIAPILFDGDIARIGPVGEDIGDPDREHVVVMRRLPEGRDALSLLDKGELGTDQLEAVSVLLSRFHEKESLGRPAPWNPEQWFARTARPVRESLTAIAQSKLIEPPRIEMIGSLVEERLAVLRPRFEARRLAGRAVDAHGDLHLDHLWFDADAEGPLLIDCIEFNADLRRIDQASEVAFLAMDLRYRDRNDLAEWFLASYAMQSDDYDLFPVVDFFASYRALVRAKVAALAAADSNIAESQRARARTSVDRHLRLAQACLETRKSAGIVLLCGTVGSGKSSVARFLAQSDCGIPIVSDRVRKVLAGVSPTTHLASAPDAGLYEQDKTEEVYRALLERADAVTRSGRTALLDASFARRSHRDAARRWASERGLEANLLEVRCQPEIAIARLRRRSALGTDPSDAGPDFLSISEARFEPPDEWPDSDHRVIWTG